MNNASPIFPGATLGVLGGGQLGRMFVHAAQSMGYRVVVLDPQPQCPAGQAADAQIVAAYDDVAALAELGAQCDAVTTEFENVPADTLAQLQAQTRVAPRANAVATSQDRADEKTLFTDIGLKTVPWRSIVSEADIDAAVATMQGRMILKTARLGYDGKGQVMCHSADEVREAFAQLNGVPCVLEQCVNLALEVSVVMARSANGECAVFPLAENEHRNGILHLTRVPAAAADDLAQQARDSAIGIAEHLDYCGVLAVEFFVTEEGELLVNEMAPRPHNSGHYTLNATQSSQFEQQVRALCALPLAGVALQQPVAMLNLLGDLWANGQPQWDAALNGGERFLHLYGKADAKPGRKMGHLNCLGGDVSAASASAEAAWQVLNPQ